MPFSNMKPKALWNHFKEILKIPHCSGNEGPLADYILDWAQKKGLEARRDDNGNVLVMVPASKGCESSPVVVLQGHMDMVCEKNTGIEHDFSKDPIEAQIDGDWLKAKGTTLGADNGIGVSAALAVADSEDLKHGPLDLLFTVDEEVGLTGAGKLENDFVRGRILLNLDSEELGAVYIGCSGGGDSTIKIPVKRSSGEEKETALKVKVTGLRGGHSGINIQDQRGNAIEILARIIIEAKKKHSLRLVSICGGNKRNAIPREAEAVILAEAGEDSIRKSIQTSASSIRNELGRVDPELSVELEEIRGISKNAFDDLSTVKTLQALIALPHGVLAMSLDVPGLVETSNNLATVESDDAWVTIGTSSRSSIASALQAVRDSIRAVGELAGGTVEENEPYPGWKPNPDSKLLAVVRKAHQDVFKKEPEIKAIHAGLECGIIGERFEGMEMVSFGPRIEAPHSPDERVSIPSVNDFWMLLKAVLERLTEKNRP